MVSRSHETRAGFHLVKSVEYFGGKDGTLPTWVCQLTLCLLSYSHCWLQELITCVCMCSSELQASKALAQLLCAGGKDQVVCVDACYSHDIHV